MRPSCTTTSASRSGAAPVPSNSVPQRIARIVIRPSITVRRSAGRRLFGWHGLPRLVPDQHTLIVVEDHDTVLNDLLDDGTVLHRVAFDVLAAIHRPTDPSRLAPTPGCRFGGA